MCLHQTKLECTTRPAPLVMEFWPSSAFLRDREFAAKVLGMRYMAWWDDRWVLFGEQVRLYDWKRSLQENSQTGCHLLWTSVPDKAPGSLLLCKISLTRSRQRLRSGRTKDIAPHRGRQYIIHCRNINCLVPLHPILFSILSYVQYGSCLHVCESPYRDLKLVFIRSLTDTDLLLRVPSPAEYMKVHAQWY